MMTALRQEAFELLEAMPEERLSPFIRYMREQLPPPMTESPVPSLTDSLTGILRQDTDMDREREERLREKYAIAD